MAYCYECGEQVVETDVFCPYCGISLSPLTVGDDDSFSKTIAVIQPESIAVSSAVFEGKTAQEEPHSDEELKEMENLFADKSSDSLKGSEQTNVSGAQPPKNLRTLNPLVESSAESTVSNTVKDDEIKDTESSIEKSAIKPIEDINLEPVFVSGEGDSAESSIGEIDYSQTESALMAYEEIEIKEVLSADEPEKSADEIISEIKEIDSPEIFADDDFVPTVNFSAANFNAQLKNATPENLQMRERLVDNLTVKESPATEQPIAMPEADLPAAADNCPPARFDSVSIMEKSAAKDESSWSAKKPGEETEIAEGEEQSEEKLTENKEQSFTQPNIGGGSETDNKNKIKLKPLDEGTVLNGRYEIVRKIGGGGMGAVYLASDKNLGGVLRAVKEMVQSYIEDAAQEKAVNDFKRESLLLTSLDHQSIPTIYDYFFDEKEARFYLVMKYISGGDLSSRLRSAPEGRINETEVAMWAVQITEVLDYLHNRQPPIVYRDLKPANIMIDSNSGRAMLIDFGIARWVNKEEKGVTAVGTMGYAPPELFSGNVEPRSDIYSLGSTMFHLLTGADPQNNPLLIFDFQKHPRPRQINPQLSDQMERILMQAVEYSADKRFANAAEMRQTLEEHLENQKAGRVTFGIKEAPTSIALSDQPVFCGFCGQKIVATDMFCAFCGAKQPLAQKGIHSGIYASAPLTAQLLIVGTNDLETPAFILEKEDNLVGRRDPMSNIFPEVDLSKYDPQTKISRRHARIWRTGSEFMVEDLGSSNGTYILPVVSDSVRLQPHQPQLLTNGDKIKLGDTTLHFMLG